MVSPPSLLSGLTITAALLILPNLTLASPGPILPTRLTTHPLATPTPETTHNPHRRSASPGRPPEDRMEPVFGAHYPPTPNRGLTYKPNWLDGKIPAKEVAKLRHHRFNPPTVNDPYDSYDGGPDYDGGYRARRGVPTATVDAIVEGVEVEGDGEQNLIVLPGNAVQTVKPEIEVLEEFFGSGPFITLVTRDASATATRAVKAVVTNTKTGN